MRFLETSTLTLEEKSHDRTPPYAILSHTWGENEVVFEDIVHGTLSTRSAESISKVQKTCEQARKDGFKYVWIDTCCIDKSSSAELSEAINSMFAWYREATICYAFLKTAPDATEKPEEKAQFSADRWFTRGFTLQELLAPADVVFFSGSWQRIGNKANLAPLLAKVTGIDENILLGTHDLSSASVAKRMSWASKRQTTRPEDQAYCLMGIFSVNMPMLYGEGGVKAFIRLQEEIMKDSNDQSLFAWVDLNADPDKAHGLLATSPSKFAYSNSIIPYDDWEPRDPYQMTNRGLRIDLHLTPKPDGTYVAAIDCPAPPNYKDSSFLAIYLRKQPGADRQYVRVKAGGLASVPQRGSLTTIYVRQFPKDEENEVVLPNHVVQLRRGPSSSKYHVVNMLKARSTAKPPIAAMFDARSWIPKTWDFAFSLSRGPRQLAAAIIFERDDGERLAILIGSAEAFTIAFAAVELHPQTDVSMLSLGDLRAKYEPSTAGRFDKEYHSIRVSASTGIKESTKYYLVDIEIEAVQSSIRLLDFGSHVDALSREIERRI